MAKPIRRKRMRKGWQVALTALLLVAVLFYIGYQAYRSIYSDTNTELAVAHSVYETIETKGLVYRSETLVPDAQDGSPYFAIENGTHVAKSSVIASVYPNDESGRIEQQIKEIDVQINALKTIVADAGSGRLTLDAVELNEQFTDTLLQMIRDTETGDLVHSGDYAFSILSLLSKKDLVTGNKEVDFAAKIQELEAEKASLKEAYLPPIATIKAPDAGYFADSADGYESLLTTEDVRKLTTAKLSEHMESQPETVDACGKIVKGYEWFLACEVSYSYYNALGEGKTLTVCLPFVTDEALPVEVYYTSPKDDDGNMVVVFRCDQMNAKLATIRNESVEIRLVEHSGIKVPKRAIVVKDDVTGVYIRSGNVAAFRKIEQTYSQPADYVICEIIEEDGYLQMYDDIIVGGRDMYDGKILR